MAVDVAVGRVAKAHGIHGELAVEVRTDSPEKRFGDGSVLAALPGGKRNEQARMLTVRGSRPHGNRLLVSFEQVRSREEAEALRGCLLVMDTADLPPAEEADEFYDYELIGLTAESRDGRSMGTVRDVVHTPGNEVLVLERDGEEILVPFVATIVPTIDVATGRLVVDPPDGLVE